MKLLLVEDCLTDAVLFSEYLSELCRTIEIATTLQEGITLLSDDLDVIMLDLHLPDSDGLDTVRRMRHACNETKSAALLIVVSGAVGGTYDEHSLIIAGADGTIAKNTIISGPAMVRRAVHLIAIGTCDVTKRRHGRSLHRIEAMIRAMSTNWGD